MRTRLATTCSFVILLACSTASADSSTTGDQARQLADHAVQVNPSIKAIDARIEALRQRVRQASAWLDPQVSVDYSNMPIDAWRPGEHPMSGIQFNLKQTFFFPGKVGLRQAVAEGEVREARQTLGERKVQLRATVERAYYELALVRQLRKVTEDHIKLLAQFTDAVRIKYEVGRAGQHDLLRLQVLGAKLEDELKNFDRDDRALTAAINAALHRSASISIATPRELGVVKPAGGVQTFSDLAQAQRPLLEQLRQRERTREAAARLAAREGYPDITAWGGYRLRLSSDDDAGTDFIGLGLSVPIPLWYDRRWGSERRRNEALAQAAEHQRQAAFDELRGKLGRAVASWQRAADQANVYRANLMPAAHRALDATFAAYQVGRAEFASLFQAEVQLLNFERTIRRAEAATLIHRSEVEALIGKRIDEGVRDAAS